MNHLFRFTISTLLIFSSLMTLDTSAREVYRCVWRNPERTMNRLFPDAKDYKTITIRISSSKLKVIEKKAGKLLPGQDQAFQYFEMLDSKGNVIGYTMASTQKGEYGAIEFVFGLNKKRNIKGIYIQRARERDREFKKKYFLDQFKGIGPGNTERLRLWKGVKGKKTTGTKAIVSGIVKELVALDVLVK